MYHKVTAIAYDSARRRLTCGSLACGPLQDSFEFASLAPNATEYGYCAIMLNSIYVPDCTNCLAAQSNEYYLTNCM